jgi:hypothetical protein
MSVSYLWSFHYFRAFAILNIVILHLWVLPSNGSILVHHQIVIKELLFHSSTLYFIFISGFLVMHLKERITTKGYFISKLKNVILPYILISFGLIFVYGFFGSKTETLDYNFIKKSFLDILYGKVNFHFWYIPFISLVFLMTPFIIRLDKKILLFIAPLILLLPLLGTRSGTEITLGQYLYFFPIYITGMIVRLKLEKVQEFVKHYFFIILAGFITTFLVLFFLLKNYDFNNSYPSYYEGLYYLNRLLVIFIYIKISNSITSNRYPIIGKIADYSFALYFIHGAIGIFLQPFFFSFLDGLDEVFWIPVSLILTLCIILLCICIIKITKLMLGKNSKFLIGY